MKIKSGGNRKVTLEREKGSKQSQVKLVKLEGSSGAQRNIILLLEFFTRTSDIGNDLLSIDVSNLHLDLGVVYS